MDRVANNGVNAYETVSTPLGFRALRLADVASEHNNASVMLLPVGPYHGTGKHDWIVKVPTSTIARGVPKAEGNIETRRRLPPHA